MTAARLDRPRAVGLTPIPVLQTYLLTPAPSSSFILQGWVSARSLQQRRVWLELGPWSMTLSLPTNPRVSDEGLPPLVALRTQESGGQSLQRGPGWEAHPPPDSPGAGPTPLWLLLGESQGPRVANSGLGTWVPGPRVELRELRSGSPASRAGRRRSLQTRPPPSLPTDPHPPQRTRRGWVQPGGEGRAGGLRLRPHCPVTLGGMSSLCADSWPVRGS